MRGELSKMANPEYLDQPYRISPMERLLRKKEKLTEELDAVTKAIEGLEKHPEVNEILELLSKAEY